MTLGTSFYPFLFSQQYFKEEFCIHLLERHASWHKHLTSIIFMCGKVIGKQLSVDSMT